MCEATDLSRKTQTISLFFAAILGMSLALFAITLMFSRKWLSTFRPGGISIYVALLVSLSVGAWLLTWIYMVLIHRIERARRDGQPSAAAK